MQMQNFVRNGRFSAHCMHVSLGFKILLTLYVQSYKNLRGYFYISVQSKVLLQHLRYILEHWTTSHHVYHVKQQPYKNLWGYFRRSFHTWTTSHPMWKCSWMKFSNSQTWWISESHLIIISIHCFNLTKGPSLFAIQVFIFLSCKKLPVLSSFQQISLYSRLKHWELCGEAQQGHPQLELWTWHSYSSTILKIEGLPSEWCMNWHLPRGSSFVWIVFQPFDSGSYPQK